MHWKQLEEPAGNEPNVAEEYRKKTRFLVDEDLGIGFAQLLRDMGYDALHTSELQLSHRDDTQVLAGAKRRHRVLLSHDRDYLDTRRHPLRKNPGILVLPQGKEKSKVREAILRPLAVLFAHYGKLWDETRTEMTADGTFTMEFIDETGAILRSRYRLTSSDYLEEWVTE